MGQRIYKSIQLIAYILMPESSLESDPDSRRSIYPPDSADRLFGCIKSATWILAAIGLSLVLGQLR